MNRMIKVVVSLLLTFLFASVVLVYVYPTSTQSLAARQLTCKLKPHLCVPILPKSPSQAVAPDDVTRSGRWTVAASDPHLLSETGVGFKQWIYASFASDSVFVAFALVRFAYVSDVFLYVVPRTGPMKGEMLEYHSRAPLGVGLDPFSSSSTTGCSVWGLPQVPPFIVYCARQSPTGGYILSASVPVYHAPSGTHHHVEVYVYSYLWAQSLVLAFPLATFADGHERLAYVHKGMMTLSPERNQSWVRFTSESNPDLHNHTLYLTKGTGALDWTKGHLSYRTAWRWVSLSDAKATLVHPGHSHQEEEEEVMVGLNLSNEVYDILSGDDMHEISAENAVWVNGAVYSLNRPVDIVVPARENRTSKPWRIVSRLPGRWGSSEYEFVNLTFVPQGARGDSAHFGIIVSDFVQPFGTFEGTIVLPGTGTLVLRQGTFGVVEDHLAYW